jgi:hypothetical protein
VFMNVDMWEHSTLDIFSDVAKSDTLTTFSVII